MSSIYGSETAAANISVTIAALVVPARAGYILTGVKAWANCDLEYGVYLNGLAITGGITSGASKSESFTLPTVLNLQAFDVVMLVASHSENTEQTLYGNLFYEQL